MAGESKCIEEASLGAERGWLEVAANGGGAAGLE
jgi:hypothetical protein